MVRVPRLVVEKYYSLPFAELEAAAERGDDGLCVEFPNVTPWHWSERPPKREYFAQTDEGEQRFQEANAEYQRDKDHAYFRGGSKNTFDDGPSWLYQQNW